MSCSNTTPNPPILTPKRLAVAMALAMGSPLVMSLTMSSAMAAPVACDVTEEHDDGFGIKPNTLSWAIQTANNGSVALGSHPGGGCIDNVITLKTDVRLNRVMLRFINSDITIQSQITDPPTLHFISGDAQFRPLFVKSGQVLIKNIGIVDGLAQGGESRAGGGGAGFGGGLFVYSGQVTLEDVVFDGNRAVGGMGRASNGGTQSSGGGGMFGDAETLGGGGLFGSSRIDDIGAAAGTAIGGYGGTFQYGGGSFEPPTQAGFGRGGPGIIASSCTGGYSLIAKGGFGGGGGNCDAYGLAGGFGGGGGGNFDNNFPSGSQGATRGGWGGFGGGGGGSYARSEGFGGYGGGNGTPVLADFDNTTNSVVGGGGGAGFGGAIFVKSGTLVLKEVEFTDNSAMGGQGAVNDGAGRGGAVFVCTNDLIRSWNPKVCGGSIDEAASCAVSFGADAQVNTASNGEPTWFWTRNDADANTNHTLSIQAICPTPLTLTDPTISKTKTYDGTTDATVNLGSVTGVRTGDTVSVAATASYPSAEVGTNLPITVTYAVSGDDASGYLTPDDFVIADGAILAKDLIVTGLTGVDKIYDGTPTALVQGTATLSGVISGDDVLLTGSPVFSFLSADVGDGQALSITGFGLSGADAGNYALVLPSLSAGILFKPMTTSGIVAQAIPNQVYTGAPVEPSVVVQDGSVVLVQESDYTLSYQDNINPGTAKVTITGMGNYEQSLVMEFLVQGIRPDEVFADRFSTNGS